MKVKEKYNEVVATLRKVNKTKLRDELLTVGVILIGVIWFICGIKKIAPGMDGIISSIITMLVSVGYLAGPGCSILGICGFFEVRNKKYSRKKRHRK